MAKEKKTTKSKVKKAVAAVKEVVAKKEAPKKATKVADTFIKGFKVLTSEEVEINGNKKVKALLSNHTIVIVNEDEVKSEK